MAFSGGAAVSGASSGAQAGAVAGPWGAAIGAVVGGAFGGIMGGKASAAIKRAERAQRRIERMQAFKQRVDLQRSYNAQRAEVVAAAANEGVSGASAVQGTLAGFGSQVNAEFGRANFVDNQMSIIRKANNQAQKYTNNIAMFQQLAAGVSKVGSAIKSSATAAAAKDDLSAIPEAAAPVEMAGPQSFFSAQGSGFGRNQPYSFYSEQ